MKRKNKANPISGLKSLAESLGFIELPEMKQLREKLALLDENSHRGLAELDNQYSLLATQMMQAQVGEQIDRMHIGLYIMQAIMQKKLGGTEDEFIEILEEDALCRAEMCGMSEVGEQLKKFIAELGSET